MCYQTLRVQGAERQELSTYAEREAPESLKFTQMVIDCLVTTTIPIAVHDKYGN